MNSNLIKNMAIIISLIIVVSCTQQSSEVSIVKYPTLHGDNSFYPGNKAPLQKNHLIKLPLGSISPEGWILKLMELQRDGLCGNLGEISAWLDKENNAWLAEGGDHGWEEVPYWLRGYADMAFLFQDEDMVKESMLWIEAILASQKSSGWFGPEVRSGQTGHLDFWPNMVVLFTLQHYYEYSGDKRVIEFMKKYFRYELSLTDEEFLSSYWENSRGGDNLYSVYWLYNIIQEDWLLDLAHKIHANTADWTQKSNLPNWHNVNIAECFREPATYFMQTGDTTHLQATYNDFDLIRRTFGQVPGGMFGSDENARMGYIDPRQGTETCGFAEQMTSDGILISITGDSFWADNCEDVLFNSFTASFTSDMKALRYITCPNGVTADGLNHAPGIANAGPFLTMNPFSSRCCQHNHGHALPYYLQNLVMATNDNGLAAVMYNSCTTKATVGKGTNVIIKQQTNYPFSEDVEFTFLTEQDVNFPFYLRIPGWCDEAKVTVNDALTNIAGVAGNYFKIERNWKAGDKVVLHLPRKVSIRQWQVNQNSVSVDYGALTFSLKIDEEYTTLNSAETAIYDSKWQKDADTEKWPSYEIQPKSAWNYGLVMDVNHPESNIKIIEKDWPEDNYPFSIENVPIKMITTGARIPSWSIDKFGLADVLPKYPAQSNQKEEEIELVPMGAARLRISAFPLVTDIK